ncbi:hypothetical protein D1007_09654 [Hordeum vulgare]|nr:hypothetical protein D1007_09654 [Hordeum vulgare]
MSRAAANKSRTRGAWDGSDVDEGHIEFLRHHRKLPSTERVGACLPEAENSPAPKVGKVVVFAEHFARGFWLPASAFFSTFVTHFGLQAHHLAANTVLQLAAYVILCEGFLGIEPRLDLWRHLFYLTQQSLMNGNINPRDDHINMPPFVNAPPTEKRNWQSGQPHLAAKVKLIYARLELLTVDGLTAADLLTTMVSRRILPLQC